MTAGTRHHREFWTQQDDEKHGPVIDPLVALVVTIGLILGLFFIVISLENEPTASAHHTAAATQASPSPMLRLGSTGEPVKSVQSKLNSFGYSLAVDGQYGPVTTRAVTHWQKANRLTVDGITGPQTLASLGLTAGATVTAPAERGEQTQITPPPPPPPAPAPSTWTYCPQWEATAKYFGLDDRFDRIMYRESRCQPGARNRSGASGLVQIMPMWVPRLGHCGINSTADLLDGDKNLCGAKFILDTQGINAWSQTR